MPTRPDCLDVLDSTAETAPLAGSIDATETNTGRFASPASVCYLTPSQVHPPHRLREIVRAEDSGAEQHAPDARIPVEGCSAAPGCIARRRDESDRRRALGQKSTAIHAWVGIVPVSDATNGQSGLGTAAPTQFSNDVPWGRPVEADASARIPGPSKSRNEAAMIEPDAALRAAPAGESETANTLGGHVHAERFATLVTGELEHKSVLG